MSSLSHPVKYAALSLENGELLGFVSDREMICTAEHYLEAYKAGLHSTLFPVYEYMGKRVRYQPVYDGEEFVAVPWEHEVR